MHDGELVSKFRSKSAVFTLATLCLAGSGPSAKVRSPEGQVAIRVVESLCSAEWDGDEERAATKIILTKAGRSKLGFKDSPDQPTQWDWHPLVIVGSRALRRAQVQGRKGTVVMAFKEIARSHGHGDDRTFEPLEPLEREVTYHVVKRNGGWFVVDPPAPRTALKVVLKALEAKKARLEEGVKINQAQGRDAGFQTRILHKVDSSMKVLLRLKGGRGVEKGRDPDPSQGPS